MYEKSTHYRMPSNVEEAAELLISDLLMQHLLALSVMTDDQFDTLCDKVTPYLIDEFRLWQGNDSLLASCFSKNSSKNQDPARIILEQVKKILKNFHGFVVIT
ncbi:MAG: hypothetical protein GY874_20655 [Desulfobacteraceae bacterium]|nr:hypothetical protein [Desulfobacteraceae bacterium]